MNNLTTIKELVGIKSYSEEENSEIVQYLISKFENKCKEIVTIKDVGSNKNNLIT